ncbi:MAG: hypothetical protein LBC97_03745 [Bifidobacteriaceae bacterium]|jgi:hypothetical protein|nr:hypothetical protein [Bifidobacteriaceae bacterium]
MSDGSISVFGGAAGAISCLQDLDVLALRLDLARAKAEEADAASRVACGASSPLPLTNKTFGVVCDPIEQQAYALTGAALEGFYRQVGTGHLVEQLAELSRRVLAAQTAYQQAEEEAETMFASIRHPGFSLADWMLPWPFSVLGRLGGLAINVALDAAGRLIINGEPPSWAELLRSHHEEVRGVLGAALSPTPLFRTPSTTEVTRGITGVATMAYGPGLDVTITRGKTKRDRPPTGVESLIWRIAGLADNDKSDSQIGVTKVTAPDGSVSWLVSVPGTQSMSLGSDPNASDMGTNVRAVPGDVNAMGLAAAAAMIDAGIKKGEPVVLSGHSQGGIVSAALAADPAFAEQFSVAAVLTLGSPVSQLKHSGSAQWLSLEHTQDIIPTLSGGGNPRGPNQTTIVRDVSGVTDPAIRDDDILWAHHLPIYADTAKQVDQSGDGSIEAWREAASPVFDPKAKVETTVYQVKRDLPAS